MPALGVASYQDLDATEAKHGALCFSTTFVMLSA